MIRRRIHPTFAKVDQPAYAVERDLQTWLGSLSQNFRSSLEAGRRPQEAQTRYNLELRRLLHRVAEYSLQQVGPSPARFAWVSLGSVAELTSTPGSDLDHALLLSEATPASLAWGRHFAYAAQGAIGPMLPSDALLSPDGLPPLTHTPSRLTQGVELRSNHLSGLFIADTLHGDEGLCRQFRKSVTQRAHRVPEFWSSFDALAHEKLSEKIRQRKALSVEELKAWVLGPANTSINKLIVRHELGCISRTEALVRAASRQLLPAELARDAGDGLERAHSHLAYLRAEMEPPDAQSLQLAHVDSLRELSLHIRRQIPAAQVSTADDFTLREQFGEGLMSGRGWFPGL